MHVIYVDTFETGQLTVFVILPTCGLAQAIFVVPVIYLSFVCGLTFLLTELIAIAQSFETVLENVLWLRAQIVLCFLSWVFILVELSRAFSHRNPKLFMKYVRRWRICSGIKRSGMYLINTVFYSAFIWNMSASGTRLSVLRNCYVLIDLPDVFWTSLFDKNNLSAFSLLFWTTHVEIGCSVTMISSGFLETIRQNCRYARTVGSSWRKVPVGFVVAAFQYLFVDFVFERSDASSVRTPKSIVVCLSAAWFQTNEWIEMAKILQADSEPYVLSQVRSWDWSGQNWKRSKR